MFKVHSSVVRRHEGDFVDWVLFYWVQTRGVFYVEEVRPTLAYYDVELVGEDGCQNVDMAIKFRVGIGTIGYLHSYKHKEPIMSLYLYIFDLVPILVSMSMSTINLTLPTYVVC